MKVYIFLRPTESFVRFNRKINPLNCFEVVDMTKIRQKSEGSHPKKIPHTGDTDSLNVC